MIKLKDLLKGLDYTIGEGFEKIDINRVVDDSRSVNKDDLFVAISGEDKDGHGYIAEALRRGARAVVYQKDIGLKDSRAAKIKVKDSRKAAALLARNLYHDPSKNIKIIGITGTNGKTTVSYLLESIFKKARFKVGLIGTIRYKIQDETIEAGNTTPSPLILQSLIRKMVDNDLDYCIMEASSHALDQHRTDYIDFNSAVFTNATREHLDYHKNFVNYLNAKMVLFRGMGKNSSTIINNDDPSFLKIKKSSSSKKIISFGISKDADIYADNLQLGMDGTSFILHIKNRSTHIESHLIGVHNIYNMLAAASCAVNEGMDLGMIKEGLEATEEIEGRLQSFDTPSGIKVFVDYAHTDDALKKVLGTLGRLKKNRLITLFGCGGNRDKKKRPRMAKVATALSDYVIITSDNPRYEDPQDIINDIKRGIKRGSKNFKAILDRRSAIEEALQFAKKDDIVLLAGKGHEKYQVVEDKMIPFDDLEVAKEFIKQNA